MYTVLLADDREVTREAYARLLRSTGYRTVCACDGREACSLARDLQPDLIVMDLRMPVLDGWEATRILKGDPTTAHIPIAALTAYADPAEINPRHAECGFDAVWQKPFAPLQLLDRAARLLGDSHAA
jgi:two-component system, cell cycle response regulator DivK